MRKTYVLLLVALSSFVAATAFRCSLQDERRSNDTPAVRTRTLSGALEERCKDVAKPKVREVASGVWLASGYDLANTILVQTKEGNVVIDVSTSVERARLVRRDLLAVAPGPLRAIVYTHSHLDHVGGAEAWLSEEDEEVQIWATTRFHAGFFEKYGTYREIETLRGRRQFGRHLSHDELPCTSIGPKLDLAAALKTGVRMPTHLFDEESSFEVGGVTFELHSAPGETPDQLFVYIREKDVLLPGDNYYAAFPNLYTIRGGRPRPVQDWIKSLDKMRRKEASLLIPSHTGPIAGKSQVSQRLTEYRDAIQWVHDAVVRGANQGLDVETIAGQAGLPPQLAALDHLQELYGQVDWSARAIYSNELGWFDGRPHKLYPLPEPEAARRTVELMGGPARVVLEAENASERGDHRWTLELLAFVEEAAGSDKQLRLRVDALAEASLSALGQEVANSNGRAYLLESARERRFGVAPPDKPTPNEALVDALPLEMLFGAMRSRLRPGEAQGVLESVVFAFTDTEERFVLTVRNGILEVVRGAAIPGTPAALATVVTDCGTWRRLATEQLSPLVALATGRLKVRGELAAFQRFMGRFNTKV